MSKRLKRHLVQEHSGQPSERVLKGPYAGSGGATGKGGGGGGATAQEDPDSLVSRAFARILDILTEGPINGWTHPTFPLLDIALDGTVVQNNDAWGVQSHGQTTNGSRTFIDNTVTFPVVTAANGDVRPFKSPIVGRWITGTNIPPFTVVSSVEEAHHLTLSQAATGTGSGLTWQLGGSLNFKNFQFQFRTGTQNQTALIGFPASEVTTAVGIRVTKTGSPGDWTSPSFTDTTLDAIRVDMRFPRLQKQNTTTGDVHGTSVRIKIYCNGQLAIDDTITGKASSPYVKTYQIELVGRTIPAQIRVQRVTADSQSQALANETWVDSYTEVVYGKLRHPNTALVGLRVSAEQFQQIPARAYHIKGLIVKIPSNYNPITRVYTGIWDGTFTSAWTDNPAWCFYDMCTNSRYGLGNQLVEANIDKWTLYTIGQYCDEMVNDGKGGLEPRFTCNLYIQRHEDAIKVLQDMAGMFRGILAYMNGTVTPVQDAPQPTSVYKMFTPVNVIDGVFSYSGTGLRARHNVAVVSWSDPNDIGALKQEYVEDHDGITQSGAINQLDLTGFGCASRGQARRLGLWSIYAEKILTDTVAFSTGLEGYFIPAGGLISIQDPFRAGVTLSGRLQPGSTATHLFLDRTITIISGHTYGISVINPSTNALTTVAVTQGAGTWSDITVNTLGFTPDGDSVFEIGDIGVVGPEFFRVFAASVKENNVLEVTAIKYNASLYDFVDFNHPLEEPPISQLPGATQTLPPTNLLLGVIQVILPGNQISQLLELSWVASPDPYLARYKWRYRRDSGNWSFWTDSATTSYTYPNAQPGGYEVQVIAVNTLGVISDALEGEITITPPPSNITGVTGLELFDQGNDNIFQTRDAHFIWRVAGDQGAHGPSFPGDEGIDVGTPSPLATAFDVTFWLDETLLWQDRTVNSEYVYTWEKNRERAEAIFGPGTAPIRMFRIEVRVIFDDNSLSDPARLTVVNPQPGPPSGVQMAQQNGYVTFQWTPAVDPDIDHYSLYSSLDPNDNEPVEVAQFFGTSGIYYPPDNQAYSYWIGSVDTFGNISSNVPQGPPPGGIVQVPHFTPVPGTYQTTQFVVIGEDTPNCAIYYSLVNIGQAPTTWQVFSGSVIVSSSKRIYAVAVSNYDPTQTASAVGDFLIVAAPEIPQFDPKGGFYTVGTIGRKLVQIATGTSGAWLFWTTDGTTPTHDASGNPTGTTQRMQRILASVFMDEGTTTLKALAWKLGIGDSAIHTDLYTIALTLGPACATPTYAPAAGPVTFPVGVRLSCADPADCRIEYSINGLIPPIKDNTQRVNNNGSIIIQGPGPVYLKSVAYRRGRARSEVAIARYYQRLATPPPYFNPGPGNFFSFPFNVTISVALGAAQIRYTLDGTNPTKTHGTLIASNSGVVPITQPGTMLRAVGFATNYDVSPITTGLYRGKIATPTHTPDSTGYTQGGSLNVDIDVAGPGGGVIVNARYTLDGTRPTRTHGTLIPAFPTTVVISGGFRELQTVAFQVSEAAVYADSDVKDSTYDWISPTWVGGS